MPQTRSRPDEWASQHPWIWGVAFGVIVALAVLVVSAALHGVRESNAMLALVLFVGFGLLGVVGAIIRRFTPGGPT